MTVPVAQLVQGHQTNNSDYRCLKLYLLFIMDFCNDLFLYILHQMLNDLDH